MKFDGANFGREIVEAVKSHIDLKLAPIVARIEAIEARKIEHGKDGAPGKDGADVDLEAVTLGVMGLLDGSIETAVLKAVADLPVPKDGTDGAPGKDGTDGAPGKDAEAVDVAAIMVAIDKKFELLPAPKDGAPGKDVDMNAVAEMFKDYARETGAQYEIRISEAIAAIPTPKDGESVTIEQVSELVSKAVASLPKAQDGVGLAGAIIDRTGNLVLTMTDGRTRDLGCVVGKDADRAEIETLIKSEVAKIPAPKDGVDGKDGFDFEDMTETLDDDGRTLVRRYERGERVKEFRHTLAVPLDRGVWKEGKYVKGDSVTLNGSWFIAQCDTEARPEVSKDWRLAVKRGQNGKDGKPGEKGAQGIPGKDGKDLTQLTLKGQKY